MRSFLIHDNRKFAQVCFLSFADISEVNEIFDNINNVYKFSNMRISTGTLNDVLSQLIVKTPPPTHKGKRLKIYYMTQVSVCPPTFVFFVNKAELFHFSYKHYIENNLREIFNFLGTPIRFIVREKSEKNFEPKI